MSVRRGSGAWVLLCAAAWGCGPLSARESSLADGDGRGGSTRRAAVRREVVVGGPADLPWLSPSRDDGGPGLAVAADAGLESAEVAWLVAHLGDSPDRLDPADSANVRALAARGAQGVLAVAAVFRQGDAARVPFARRVLERVAYGACRRSPGGDPSSLLAWVELGYVPGGARPDGGAIGWTRLPEDPWPPQALARLRSWAESGVLCAAPGWIAGSHDGERSDAGPGRAVGE